MGWHAGQVTNTDSTFTSELRGTFYRAIDPSFREFAIAGSRSAGRYSRAHEPTLYLSSSVDGVEAAMIAHKDARSAALEIVEIEVEAAGIDLADAVAPWQDVVASGGTPPSWAVRDHLLELGTNGLIDPSRKRPGLWHLVLFRWNEAGAPTVRLT